MKRFVTFTVILGLAAAALAQEMPVQPRFVQDRFAIGSWVEPPFDTKADARYKEMAEAGFNTVLAGFSGVESTAFLEVMKHYGLKALLWPKGEDPVSWPDTPQVWGYSLQDEPNASDFSKLGQRVAAIRQQRPGKLAYINLFPDYASAGQLGAPTYEDYLTRFQKEVNVDVLSMDHYPIFRPDRDGRDDPIFRPDRDGREGYCGNLAAMRQHSSLPESRSGTSSTPCPTARPPTSRSRNCAGRTLHHSATVLVACFTSATSLRRAANSASSPRFPPVGESCYV